MTARQKKLLYRIIAALILFAVLVIIEKTHILPDPYNRYLFLFYLLPYVIAGGDVLRKAVLGLIHGRMLDEAFLMAIASIGAFSQQMF
jgi:Cd2+/Zn2+-exporting ATPase